MNTSIPMLHYGPVCICPLDGLCALAQVPRRPEPQPHSLLVFNLDITLDNMKYRRADTTLTLLIGQLSTLKAALKLLADWLRGKPKHVDDQLSSDLTLAIDGCRTLMSYFDEHLTKVTKHLSPQRLSIRGRVVFVWEQSIIQEYLSYLTNQVNAFNLLLSAIQW